MFEKNFVLLDYQKAIFILKNLNLLKYTESFEAIFNLKIQSKPEILKSFLFLPYGNGKEISIGILTDKSEELAHLSLINIKVGGDNLLQQICNGKYTPSILLATKDFSLKLSKMPNIIRILAKKGLFPSSNTNTIIPNSQLEIDCFLDSFLKTIKTPIKIEKDGVLSLLFGNTSYSTYALECNLKSAFETISQKKLFENNKNYSITSLLIKTSQSPSLKINLLSLE